MRNRLEIGIKKESGSALVQVLGLSVFVMILVYALSDYLGNNDNHSRRIIDRTVYMNTGTYVSELLSDPNSVIEAQGVANDKPYP